MPKITLLGIAGTLIGLFLLFMPKRSNKHEIMSAGFIVLIIGILFLIGSGVRIIEAGHVGVKVLFGNVQEEPLNPGFHIINPLINVIPMSTRTEAYTMSSITREGRRTGDDAVIALTSDGVSIKLDITSWYRLQADMAPDVYKNLGLNYSEKIVRPALRTAIRNATVEYKAEDVYSSKRQAVVKKMEELIVADLKGRGIILEKVLLRNVILPNRITQAIDEKISASQEAQKMEFVLQKEKQEAERKEVEAQGIARAQKIIADSLTDEYLTWHYIRTLSELAGSNNNTFVIAPFDQKLVPLFNVSNEKTD